MARPDRSSVRWELDLLPHLVKLVPHPAQPDGAVFAHASYGIEVDHLREELLAGVDNRQRVSVRTGDDRLWLSGRDRVGSLL